MVFETIGIAWGYIFVIVIAGCSLIIGYYRGKGKLKFKIDEPKTTEKTSEQDEKTSTETEFAVPPKDDDGENKN